MTSKSFLGYSDDHPQPVFSRGLNMGITAKVRAQKDHFGPSWFTCADMARQAGITSVQAGTTLSNLCRYGELERRRADRGHAGAPQQYRFKP